MKTTSGISFNRLPTSFEGLVRFHSPRPIHDKVGYENTVEIIDALAGQQLNQDQDDYLLLLATLVERYESDVVPKRRPLSGLSMLKYVLEENDLSGDDLAKIIGVDRSVAYRILKGDRGLTTTHIKALRGRFGVSADVFV